jgi:hypothetical protein
VGDGNTSFKGGLVFVNTLLYGIGNDHSLFATLYSFDLNGSNVTAVNSDFNTTGTANNFTFQNGLVFDGTNFYAIGVTKPLEPRICFRSGATAPPCCELCPLSAERMQA